ncbi:MAG: citrate/2-methylcitrate synthase [Acidimicrobiales bacterium]
MAEELTAPEAAARLGIKRETLYAYVSRGLVTRTVAADGRTSLFDPAEIEALRAGRQRTSEGMLETVVSTGLTKVADDALLIRGTRLVDEVAAGAGYADVVGLLWGCDDLSWQVPVEVLEAVAQTQTTLPRSARPIDRLRVSVSVMSALDPLLFDLSPMSVQRSGATLISAMVQGLPLKTERGNGDDLASLLWPRLSSRPSTPRRCRALDVAMALLVDHGLATSTFGARVAASVRADPYSLVTAALGVVGGALHGAASGAVQEMLESVANSRDIPAALGAVQRQSGTYPGFGHSVYRAVDPRFCGLMDVVRSGWPRDPRLEVVDAIADLVNMRTGLAPNVDLALGTLTWLGAMPRDAGEAIFAVSRTAGWLAHGIEEYTEPPLRFRPLARYVGPRGQHVEQMGSAVAGLG